VTFTLGLAIGLVVGAGSTLRLAMREIKRIESSVRITLARIQANPEGDQD
jgi:hypothetical protein